MNDPGLDDPIANHADDVDKSRDYEGEGEEEAEDDYLAPSRWWFTSTGFPLIAGTFGPMANAFSICALVQNWRVEIPPGGVEQHGINIEDPKWLIAVNAISLVFALVANLSLLLQLARRISFAVAQPITIVGWFMASFLLMALVGVASSRLRLPSPPDHALTQAFYYAIIASAIYFIIASLMMCTVYGAWRGHYSKEFKLTTAQRTLMLQTICLLVYMLLGALVYAHIEGWEYLDAVYWADVTIFTVGTGDYTPMTHLGRGLLFPFAIGGIVFVGLVIGSTRALVLERGKHKMSARMTEKTREKALKRMNADEGTIRLTPFKKRDVGKNANSEKDRRRREFEVMREIQQEAARQRKWTSLGISAGAWFVLWFIGAVVFWKAERNQSWTYFQSLYYSYVSLLTIGYGDFQPMSNSGKPFFVFWSLLAVPTMTVLISNMGDTIVKGVKDLTLQLGEWTVLPNESGFRETVRRNFTQLRNRRAGSNGIHTDDPGGFSGEDQATQSRSNTGSQRPTRGVDHLAHDFAAAEEEDARSARRRGDLRAADKHHYHYLLIKEIRSVMSHVHESPPRQYGFDEWAWFLRLMGEDEGSARTHRSPLDEQGGPRTDGGFQDGGLEKGPWSWLGKKSPLLGAKDEAEWVLEYLSERLERELMAERGRGDETGTKSDGAGSEQTTGAESSGG
ncbi:MAG: Potassium channel [Piccolia ochrophora]|nr:MAG: Potassium channel [Piccolia ochrophora]